jgi:hypothetical protein
VAHVDEALDVIGKKTGGIEKSRSATSTVAMDNGKEIWVANKNLQQLSRWPVRVEFFSLFHYSKIE